MKKIFCCMFAVLAMALGVSYFSHNTYATEVPVLIKIRNHEAEVSADILSEGNKITVYDTFPNVRVRYKNAIKVSLAIEDSENELIESKTQAVDLKNTEEELTFDLSEVKVDPGDYFIKVSATSVDEEEVDADDLDLSVYKEAPNVPDTGLAKFYEDIFVKNNSNVLLGGLIVAGIFALAYVVKKGVLR